MDEIPCNLGLHKEGKQGENYNEMAIFESPILFKNKNKKTDPLREVSDTLASQCMSCYSMILEKETACELSPCMVQFKYYLKHSKNTVK